MRLLIALCLFTLTAIAMPQLSFAQIDLGVDISVGTPPPAFPVYVQPAPPAPNYIWMPGYWAYDPDNGYYWIPGAWAAAPQPGLLWTPPYWGFENGVYAFHDGYWGPHVGFYGGIDYGYGYSGYGFHGGAWHGGEFVNHPVHGPAHGFSFNGPGGIHAAPRPQDMIAAHEQHFGPTEEQRAHVEAAHSDPSFFASQNHGHPAVAAVARAGELPHASVPVAQEHTPGFNREDYNTRPLNFRPHAEPVPTAEPRVENRVAAPQVQHAPAAAVHSAPMQQHVQAPRPQEAAPHPQEHTAAPHPQERGDGHDDEHGR